MGKHRAHLHIPPNLGPISLALAMAFAPRPGWGQQGMWEQLINQGNQALSRGAFSEAETRYLQALQVAEQFAPHDLRRATARRNLAQTLVLQGRFGPADSLYREAIATAIRVLEPRHPYVLSLQDELARLHKAMAEADRLDESAQGPASIQGIVLNWAEWLARRSVLQLGATMPLAGELGNTHHQGLGYGLSLHHPPTRLGTLTIDIAPEHAITTLPATHSLIAPFKLQGTSLALASTLGPLSLALGPGVYIIETGQNHAVRLGLTGSVSLAIKGRRTPRSNAGLHTAIHLRGNYIPDTEPVVEGPVTLLQAGLNLGWRW